MYPIFDHDANLLFLGGKGESNIKCFEWTNGKLYEVAENKSNSNNKAFCFLPKYCVDTTKHEVNRLFKLLDNTIETVSMYLPRQSAEF